MSLREGRACLTMAGKHRTHPSLHNSLLFPLLFFFLARARYTVIFYVIPSCPAVGHSCAGARREPMRRDRRRYSRYTRRGRKEERNETGAWKRPSCLEEFPFLPPVLHLFSFSSIRAYQSPLPFSFFPSSPPVFLSFLEERHDATATPTFRTLFTSRTTNDPGRGSFLSSSSLSPAAARDASAPDRWPIFDQRNAHGMDGSRVVDRPSRFVFLIPFVHASDRSREDLSRD